MNEFSIDLMLKILKKNWLKIALITLAVMLLAACFTQYFIPKKYSSSVEFYVVNINTDYDYTSSSLLSASSYLINDYVAIIKSEHILNPLCEKLVADGYTEITPEKIEKMISDSSKTNTSVFTLSVQSTDKTLAYKIADYIATTAPDVITDLTKSEEGLNTKLAERVYYVISQMRLDSEVTKTEVEAFVRQNKLGLDEQKECISVLSWPEEAIKHDSPSVILYTLIAGVAAFVLAYGVCLLRTMLKQTVTTEEDVKSLLNYPLLGTIPSWKQTEHGAERRNQQ